MYPEKIELQIKKFNFNYLLINKTYPVRYPSEWFDDLYKAINYIKKEYTDKKFTIIEEESDCLSSLDKKILKEEIEKIQKSRIN